MSKNLVWFSASLLGLVIIIAFATAQFITPTFMNQILSSLSITTWLIYFFMIKSNAENFIRNYLLTIVIKVIAGGSFVFILIYLDPISADANSLLFLITYILLTCVEVGFLFKKFSAS